MSGFDELDDETRALISQAKSRMAINHALMMDDDQDPAEFMRQHNKKLSAAVPELPKKKRGMVKQNVMAQPKMPSVNDVPKMESDEQVDYGVPKHYDEPKQSVKPMVVQAPIEKQPKMAVQQKTITRVPTQRPVVQQPVDETESYEIADRMGEIDKRLGEIAEQFDPRNQLIEKSLTDAIDEESQESNAESISAKPKMEFVMKQQEALVKKPAVSMVAQRDTVPSPKRAVPVMAYDTYREIDGLPSRGRFYSDVVTGQALRLIDMMMLSSIDADNVYSIFDEILARRIKGVEPGYILTCDEIFIYQWLRASSFDTKMLHPGFKCQHCGFENHLDDYGVSFMDMDFKTQENFDEIADKHKDGFYAFNLADGRECNLYLRRRYHDHIIGDYIAKYEAKHNAALTGGLRTLISTAAIVEIEDCPDMDAKVNYLSNMPYAVGKQMYSEIENSVLRTTITVDHTCLKCQGVTTTPYSFRITQYLSNI